MRSTTGTLSEAVFHIHSLSKIYRMGDVEVHALRRRFRSSVANLERPATVSNWASSQSIAPS